jgi:predicted RNA-binding Zn-ribbon protein involved in translation (DUF1610 family)
MDSCPKCKTSFIGNPIPEKDRESFGNATHFKREIGIYSRKRDMTVEYQCPDCGYTWDRFTGKEIRRDPILYP